MFKSHNGITDPSARGAEQTAVDPVLLGCVLPVKDSACSLWPDSDGITAERREAYVKMLAKEITGHLPGI